MNDASDGTAAHVFVLWTRGGASAFGHLARPGVARTLCGFTIKPVWRYTMFVPTGRMYYQTGGFTCWRCESALRRLRTLAGARDDAELARTLGDFDTVPARWDGARWEFKYGRRAGRSVAWNRANRGRGVECPVPTQYAAADAGHRRDAWHAGYALGKLDVNPHTGES